MREYRKYNEDGLLKSIFIGLDLISFWGDVGIHSEDDWMKYLRKIRFINPENKFDYAKYGDYFFIDNDLYILTDREGYRDFDVKLEFMKLLPASIIFTNKYLIKGKFAGYDMLRRDDRGERIYYGDIVRGKINDFAKCKGCKYFNDPLKGYWVDVDYIYGPIDFGKGWHYCSNPNEPYMIVDQAFGIIPNLCMSTYTEIVGNVYYDININDDKKFNFNLLGKASLPDYGVYTCYFWNYFVPKEFRECNDYKEVWEYAIKEFDKSNCRK